MNIEQLTTLFGYMTLINIFFLLFSSMFIILVNDFVKKIHSRLFGISPEKLDLPYLKYLGYFKIGLIIFNLTPFIALKLIG